MRHSTSVVFRTLVLALLGLAGCRTTPDYGRPLPEGAPALLPIEDPEDWPDFASQWYEREAIRPALERSLTWTHSEHSRRHFPQAGITHERALASLERFRDILFGTTSALEFQRAIESEFAVYQSAGWDGRGGGVLFTGYCTPIFQGSLTRGGPYQHPLYGLPPDLEKGPDGEIRGQRTERGLQPYPTRRAIEAGSLLEGAGLELVWLTSPVDAYIAHVNGSAFVELPDGELARFGYSGKNGQPYSSLGAELIQDGELPKDGVSLPAIRAWAASSEPAKVHEYLARNASYVFFTPIDGTPRGSLNLEVEPGRTLATDKTLFPRGALVFVDTRLPAAYGTGKERRDALFERFMLDQDTGGAIRTAGRADLYLGIGPEAEALAGRTKSEGQLYYLFVKQPGPALVPWQRNGMRP